jgi:hypothetical protein
MLACCKTHHNQHLPALDAKCSGDKQQMPVGTQKPKPKAPLLLLLMHPHVLVVRCTHTCRINVPCAEGIGIRSGTWAREKERLLLIAKSCHVTANSRHVKKPPPSPPSPKVAGQNGKKNKRRPVPFRSGSAMHARKNFAYVGNCDLPLLPMLFY